MLLFRCETQLFYLRRFSCGASSSRVSESNESPSGPRNRSSQNGVFRFNWSISEESSFGSYVSAVVPHLQDLLVVLRSLGKSHLTWSRYGVHYVMWVPWANRPDSSDRFS